MRSLRSSVFFYGFTAIFIATAVITLLGIIGVVEIRDGYLNSLFGLFIAELGVAVVQLFKNTDWFGQGRDISGAVAGAWWQVSRAERDNIIAFVKIRMDSRESGISLEGHAYSADGVPVAEFRQVAGFFGERGDFYYWWEGDHPGSDDDFSGVGVIEFGDPLEGTATEAVGWYTTPYRALATDPDGMEHSFLLERRKVHYSRATGDEAATMETAGHNAEKAAAVGKAVARLKPSSVRRHSSPNTV